MDNPLVVPGLNLRGHRPLGLQLRGQRLTDAEILAMAIEEEEQNVERHYPGSNFNGPGTKIATRIARGDKPVSWIDTIARQHDIDYISKSVVQSDLKAIGKSMFIPGLEATAMKIGLTAKLGYETIKGERYSGEYKTLNQEQKETLTEILESKIAEPNN